MTTLLWTWGKYVIIGLVVAAFVLVFGQPSTTRRAGAVGEVDGESLSRDVFELFRQQHADMAEQFLQAGWDENRVRDLVDQRTLDTLIQRAVLVQQGAAVGLEVSDGEIARAIRANPSFQSAGRFDRERFEVFLARSDFENERTYTQLVRQDLMIAKLRRIFESPVRISRAAARDKLRRDQTGLRLRVAAARADDFRAGLSPDEDAVARLAEQQPDRVEKAYQARLAEFRRPPQVKVSHILFTGDGALAEASAAREELLGGADFAALARGRSQDVATAGDGGALGFIEPGEMLAPFDEAAFAAEPGSLLEPVETERGVHLIRVEERQEGVDRSLEEVRLELARELWLDDQARAAADAAATAMAAALREGVEFLSAAEDAGLRIEETPRFTLRDPSIPGVGRPPGLREAAFALREGKPPPARVFSAGSDFFLISLLERHEPDAAELEPQVDVVREQLAETSRRELMRQWTRDRVAELERQQRIRRFPIYEN